MITTLNRGAMYALIFIAEFTKLLVERQFLKAFNSHDLVGNSVWRPFTNFWAFKCCQKLLKTIQIGDFNAFEFYVKNFI